MNQQERHALRKNLEGKTDRELLIDDMIATHELRKEVGGLKTFLFGNGKMGFVTKVLLWGCAISVGILLAFGERCVMWAKAFLPTP